MQFRMIARRSRPGRDGARRPGAGDGAVDLCGLGRDPPSPARGRAVLPRRADPGLPGTGRFSISPHALPPGRTGGAPDHIHRSGRTNPPIRLVREDELAVSALHEGAQLAGAHALVAIIVPEDLVPEVARRSTGRPDRPARSGRHEPAGDHRPGPGGQRIGIRRRRGRQPGSHCRRRWPGFPTPLRGHDAADPTSEHRALPTTPRPCSSTERSLAPLPSDPWHSTSTARSPSSREGATASVRAWPGISPARAHGS